MDLSVLSDPQRSKRLLLDRSDLLDQLRLTRLPSDLLVPLARSVRRLLKLLRLVPSVQLVRRPWKQRPSDLLVQWDRSDRLVLRRSTPHLSVLSVLPQSMPHLSVLLARSVPSGLLRLMPPRWDLSALSDLQRRLHPQDRLDLQRLNQRRLDRWGQWDPLRWMLHRLDLLDLLVLRSSRRRPWGQ